MKRFFLIDGHAQMFRAYYAPFPPLSSPAGEPTKATLTFTQMLLNILRDQRPDYLAVAMDFDDRTTERRELYPEYKANRDEAPEDFGPQVTRIVEILQTLGVPMFQVRGQEADDIIATIARRLEAEDVELWIVSRDKDLHQLLSDRVKLWDPMKDEILDPAVLEAKLGYTPEMAIDIQTLTGDSTDNVPGIPGVGPKKALGLLRKYGSVERILENVEKLTPKMRENFEKHADILEMSRQLVTLKADVDVDLDLEACRTEKLDAERLRPIFEELGFRRLIDLLDREAGASDGEGRKGEADHRGSGAGGAALSTPTRTGFQLVNDEKSLERFLGELGTRKRFAIDTETTSLRAAECDLVGLSFAWEAGEGWYVPVRSRVGQTLGVERVLGSLRSILEDPAYEKCGQNIKYDLVVLRMAGITLRGVVFDTMVASYVLDPSRRGHGMDSLARELLGYETIPIKDLIGSGKQQRSMLDVELDRLAEYASEDADITWRLHEVLSKDIEASEVRSLFHDVEMPLVAVLAEMEANGVKIDVDQLRRASAELGQRVAALVAEIHKAAGREFAIDSPKQLAEVLFDDLGLRVVKRTKTLRSTDASVLQTLAVETAHPLPLLVLEYRELTKLQRTYLDPLPDYVSTRDGRLHASFHQAVASTGRLSSSDPNLQNIPVRTEQGRQIRRAFTAEDADHVLIAADYSQIELRILAHLSRDPALIEAFRTDQDIHRFVASQIKGVPLDEVSREDRSRAKAVNFGIIYGQGAFGLAGTLGITRAEASRFIEEYRARYPGIVRFMEECVSEAEEKGHVTTMLGRRRPIPEIHSRNRNLRAQGERLAINTVVQGSAADMIKVAMVRIHRRIHQEKLDLKMLIQVHDELVLESPRSDAAEHGELVRTVMEEALPLDVPVRVDVSHGDNWLEGKP